MGKRVKVTPRELAVLRVVSTGRQLSEIAEVLRIGEETIPAPTSRRCNASSAFAIDRKRWRKRSGSSSFLESSRRGSSLPCSGRGLLSLQQALHIGTVRRQHAAIVRFRPLISRHSPNVGVAVFSRSLLTVTKAAALGRRAGL